MLGWDIEKDKRDKFKLVFGTDEGKDVLALLANAHFVYQTTHASDPYTTAWHEGQRTAVMEIINLVGADLESIRKRIDLQKLAQANFAKRA